MHDTIPKPRPSEALRSCLHSRAILLSTVGFEAADRSKGRYRGDEEGGPTERRTRGLSR